MIVNNRIEEYICSLDEGLPLYLRKIEKQALEDGVPIIKRPTQNLIRFILRHNNIKSILEIGAAVGFSSIFMSEYMNSEGKIITIENMESRIIKAKENIKSAGKEDKITLIEGDATKELSKIRENFDLIFIDAAKGQYNKFFTDIIDRLNTGGILLSDNVLQDGDIVNSRYAVTRRNRTIHSRMRDYLYMITHNDKVDTIVLPVGDGVTISIKK